MRFADRRCIQISIHALREEGDGQILTAMAGRMYFYPRPPRGGRPTDVGNVDAKLLISIHALREEGDVSDVGSKIMGVLFLSTPSARRATIAAYRTLP